jgi:hypothetical protein
MSAFLSYAWQGVNMRALNQAAGVKRNAWCFGRRQALQMI